MTLEEYQKHSYQPFSSLRAAELVEMKKLLKQAKNIPDGKFDYTHAKLVKVYRFNCGADKECSHYVPSDKILPETKARWAKEQEERDAYIKQHGDPLEIYY